MAVRTNDATERALRHVQHRLRGKGVDSAQGVTDAPESFEMSRVAVRFAESNDAVGRRTWMIDRRAKGSCTPTAFNSGGSRKATGVIVTSVMRVESKLAT